MDSDYQRTFLGFSLLEVGLRDMRLRTSSRPANIKMEQLMVSDCSGLSRLISALQSTSHHQSTQAPPLDEHLL